MPQYIHWKTILKELAGWSVSRIVQAGVCFGVIKRHFSVVGDLRRLRWSPGIPEPLHCPWNIELSEVVTLCIPFDKNLHGQTRATLCCWMSLRVALLNGPKCSFCAENEPHVTSDGTSTTGGFYLQPLMQGAAKRTKKGLVSKSMKLTFSELPPCHGYPPDWSSQLSKRHREAYFNVLSSSFFMRTGCKTSAEIYKITR